MLEILIRDSEKAWNTMKRQKALVLRCLREFQMGADTPWQSGYDVGRCNFHDACIYPANQLGYIPIILSSLWMNHELVTQYKSSNVGIISCSQHVETIYASIFLVP